MKIVSKKVFEEINLGGIQVKNRIVRSATALMMGDYEGKVTDKVLEVYDKLSKGNIGLIITGLTEVVKDTATHTLLTINSDEHINGLKKLVDMVHENGSKIMLQIVHHGSQISGRPRYEPFSPSGIEDEKSRVKSRKITKEEIKNIVSDFGDAALRAKKAGFDGVQIHGAHGYFYSRFLSPHYNKREDEYGGCIENRVRIIIETYEDIRKKCGEDFPIFIKINGSDYLEGGLSFEDSKKAMKILDKVGFNGIEVSGGLLIGKHTPVRKNINKKEAEAYHLQNASEIAKEIKTPIIVVGGFRNFDTVKNAISNTAVEAVAISRPLIIEPHLINRWLEADMNKSTCISCNKCFSARGTVCVFNKKKG